MKTVAVVLLSFFLLPVAAQQQDEPAWVLVERAERQIRAGQFGAAIRELRRSLALQPQNAEALFAMGRAYAAVADYSIALDYLSQALEHRDSFSAPELALSVHYERAGIYYTRRELARYRDELLMILEQSEPEESFLPERITPVFRREGLDRVLVLYRVPENGGTRARGMLGELLVGLGQYAAAGEQLALSVIQQLTTVVDAVRAKDPLYEYTTVMTLLADAASVEHISDYLGRSSLFHDLYYLAASYWGEGDQFALALWRMLSQLPGSGLWGERAGRQAADPQLEPLLVPTR